MPRRVGLAALALLCAASTAIAQQKEPIGRWAADARLVSASLPTAPGWIPAVPDGTIAPGRGLGIDLGGQVYVVRGRSIALGVGATWLTARGTSTPETPSDTATPPARPSVSSRLTSLAPQLSLNFGHSLGWSYLSAGLGRARVTSDATLTGTPYPTRASEWVKTLNYGGGARWFITDRLGVGFDVRWHKTSLVPATATHPGAPRASLLVAGAGIVVK